MMYEDFIRSETGVYGADASGSAYYLTDLYRECLGRAALASRTTSPIHRASD
jgi:hypothetical protein